MFTNKPACTIWEKTTVNRAPAYIRHVTGAVYWQEIRGQSAQRTPANEAFIAIPENSINGYIPRPDDRIVPGIVTGNAPPENALTVMQIKDFLYGSQKMQHIEVTAK